MSKLTEFVLSHPVPVVLGPFFLLGLPSGNELFAWVSLATGTCLVGICVAWFFWFGPSGSDEPPPEGGEEVFVIPFPTKARTSTDKLAA